MIALTIDQEKITSAKTSAQNIANSVLIMVDKYSTDSIERAVLRLFGVDGIDSSDSPIPNSVVSLYHEQGLIKNGISRYIAAACLHTKRDPQQTCQLIIDKSISLDYTTEFSEDLIEKKMHEMGTQAVEKLEQSSNLKRDKQSKTPQGPMPWKYLIVATGNIYEDRTQAISAVESGADIIAVIRSTAQSLLDYIPYGATTEGFGGTYATQENFKIMRQALDEIGAKKNRYIQLVNYSSGLCMAEIAACAALENLDMLLNDSMYGILFRDINSRRTLIDQHFSRLICSKANIIINTGEDNYLTTSDAIESAHTVTASQLINEAMAKNAKLPDRLLGLGHAFEIDPGIEDSLLYELSHALLAKKLFPDAPLKYMPPTKHKSTDIFFSHCLDTLFNLVTITTDQSIHLTGIPTEAIHTPFMQDRHIALKNVNYCFNAAKNLGSEIEIKKDGFIQKRALQVLDETKDLLTQIENIGLIQAVEDGLFANIKRPLSRGKGIEGVFQKSSQYSNPIMDLLMSEGAEQ
ncbi:lysine 5,6-aminomutase subunit alpha [Bacteriovoracaceae bacterium]|nr:lysine 5,6-aminomutase subunit alpha [Bacteriovoracaceae bacterium]